MRKFLLLLVVIGLISVSPSVFAHGGENSGSGNRDSRFELKIKNEIENEDEIEDEERFEVEGQKFELRGQVSAVGDNNFVVLGNTIVVDPSVVLEFEQKGLINIGDFVKVEGIIQNGTKFAREIKVMGEGAGQFKFEIKGLSNFNLQSPLPSSSPEASPSSSPTPEVSPSPSANPDLSNVSVKVKANGSLSEVTSFLEQVLVFLKGLVG